MQAASSPKALAAPPARNFSAGGKSHRSLSLNLSRTSSLRSGALQGDSSGSSDDCERGDAELSIGSSRARGSSRSSSNSRAKLSGRSQAASGHVAAVSSSSSSPAPPPLPLNAVCNSDAARAVASSLNSAPPAFRTPHARAQNMWTHALSTDRRNAITIAQQERLARARGLGEDVDVQSIISQVMHEGTLSERSLGIIKFAFDTIDTDGSGKLSQDEFEYAFKKVMVMLCREQRIEMFVKVDLDCSGTIEFDEFLSFFVEPVDMYDHPYCLPFGNLHFILLKQWSGDLNLGPQNDPIARRCAFEQYPTIESKAGVPPQKNGHAVSMFMYMHMPFCDGIVGLARDNTAHLFSAQTLGYVRQLPLWPEKTQPRYIMNACVVEGGRAFAFCTMGDGKVRVMDLACRGGSLEDRVTAVFCTKENALPTCCASFRLRDHWYVGWGDENGRVSVARLEVIWHNCDGNLGCHSVPTSFGVRISTFQAHSTDAVTRLEYWADIGMFVTSGKDGTLRFTEPDRVLNTLARARDGSGGRWTLKAYKKQHLHGMFGFARSEKHNVIATWGLEREAFVWNPYSQQPMAQLDGHGSSVMSVVFHDAADQVITASSVDKTVRIWCATTFTLTQNIIEGHQFIPSNRIVTAFVLRDSQRLIIGGPSRILARDIVVPKPFTFDSAVCCALNTDRSQIITVDRDCLIQVWDSRSGSGMCVAHPIKVATNEKVNILFMYAFNAKDGRKSVSVEAMLLDRLQRRLCLLTCDRSGMMGNSTSSVAGARLWRIEQYNYVNGELINCLNVPLDSRGEELELQQLYIQTRELYTKFVTLCCMCFAQHGADEEALLASWQDTLFAWLCTSDGGMPRDLDLRKLQAFGSDIVDIQAQATDRVFIALAEGKIMVLDRLLVKHVLRCSQAILQSMSGTVLPKQKLFLLPHASSLSVWDGDSLNRVATLPLDSNPSGRSGSSQPSAIAVDPTSSFVAVGDCSGGVRVWDVSQTSGLALTRNSQDERLPFSISFISWFKAHARRVTFIAFTSNSDIVTISSGARVRVWSVMGVELGRVGVGFQSVSSSANLRCHGVELEDPEVSSREMAVDDDVEANTITSVENRNQIDALNHIDANDGNAGLHNVDDDDDDDFDDDNTKDDDDNDDDDYKNQPRPSATLPFGQTAQLVIKSRKHRQGKMPHSPFNTTENTFSMVKLHPLRVCTPVFCRNQHCLFDFQFPHVVRVTMQHTATHPPHSSSGYPQASS